MWMDQLIDIFIAASFFLFCLCLMESLQNINTDLFSFIAATKLALIRKKRKKNGSLWSLYSISSREPHNQGLSPLKLFSREDIFQLLVWNTPGHILAYRSLFRELTFSWVTAAKWSSGYMLQRNSDLEHTSLSPAYNKSGLKPGYWLLWALLLASPPSCWMLCTGWVFKIRQWTTWY